MPELTRGPPLRSLPRFLGEARACHRSVHEFSATKYGLSLRCQLAQLDAAREAAYPRLQWVSAVMERTLAVFVQAHSG